MVMDADTIQKLNLESWPLPTEYLVELGRVAAVWADLESFLNLCIGKLVGFDDVNDPKPFILVNHAAFPQRLDMLGSLCEQLVADFPALQDYKEVIARLKEAQKLRNRYMHHGMHLDEQTGTVQMAVGSARGTLKVSVDTVAIADVRRAAMTIHMAMLALYKLVLGRTIAPVWENRRSSVASEQS
ncbi:MAG: hypothetical protein WCC59_18845 [Terriglobales bacterium]